MDYPPVGYSREACQEMTRCVLAFDNWLMEEAMSIADDAGHGSVELEDVTRAIEKAKGVSEIVKK